MSGNKCIDVDFSTLRKCIDRMKKLQNNLEEPTYEKLEFWTSGKCGSGYVQDNMYSFAKDTVAYYRSVEKLLKNTIAYLESIYALQEADNTEAKNISETGYEGKKSK